MVRSRQRCSWKSPAKCLQIFPKLDVPEMFACSCGFVDKFKKRHRILSIARHGEAGRAEYMQWQDWGTADDMRMLADILERHQRARKNATTKGTLGFPVVPKPI